MKKVIVLLVLVFSIMGCNCQKNTAETTTANKVLPNQQSTGRWEYEANTRGFFQHITVENRRVVISSDRNDPSNGETLRISEEDWNQLTGLFQKTDLEALETYKDPTQKRFYDGAAIAHLKVTLGGKSYQTKDFDHGYPPKEIEALVNKIAAYGKKD